MDAPDLTILDDEHYERLVLDNLFPPRRDTEVWELLTNADNIERTRALLSSIHQRTAATLRRRKAEREEFQQECWTRGADGKKAWFESRPEYESWRKRAANFHQRAQAGISELTKISRDRNRANNQQNRDSSRDTLRLLAIAVQRHQAVHAKAGSIAGQEDYELWQLLDRLTVPCGPNQEQTTLRTMLDFFWTDVDMVDDAEEARKAAERAMRQAPAGRSARFAGVPKARHVGNEKPLAS
ncbi:hypothetical protein ACFZAR_36155 [Streptomyces sp. NPDC008222]|uniref:hypothetical protein n=1 Tax=Streptomyces sp. NPDC008222 TaxID=3364820 RepID=UPI0036ED7EBA